MNLHEQIAKRFHESYKALAPNFGWELQEGSDVEWEQLSQNSRELMIATTMMVFSEQPRLTFEGETE